VSRAPIALRSAPAALTPPERTAMWNDGWSMPVDAAIEYAIAGERKDEGA
jgi:hypothetical protein